MNEFPLTGGCNCGVVRFEVCAPLVVVHYCHCKRCQRRTGTAASINARAAPGRRQLRFVLAWADLHQEELRENWRRARAGDTLHEVEPLR